MLIVPGDHFGMDGYLRIGFGDEAGYLREGWIASHDARRHCGSRIADCGSHSAINRAIRSPQCAIRMTLRSHPHRFRQRCERDSSSLLAEHRGQAPGAAIIGLTPRVVGIATRRARSGVCRRRLDAAAPRLHDYAGALVAASRRRSTFLRDGAGRKAAPRRGQRRLVGRRDDDARHRARRAGDEPRPRRARRRRARRHREQRSGGVRLSRARARGRARGSPIPLRGRGDGRRPGVQSRARDAAGRQRDRLSRRREQHDELHPHRDGTGAALRTRRWPKCRREASPRPTRRSTSTAGTRRRRPRRSPTSLLGAGSRRTRSSGRGSRLTPDGGRRGAGARAAAEAGRAGTARGAARRRRACGLEELRRGRSAGGARRPAERAHPRDRSARGDRDGPARREPDADRLRAALGSDHDRARQAAIAAVSAGTS